MRKSDLVIGQTYRMTRDYDGNPAGTLVELRWETEDGKFIFSV